MLCRAGADFLGFPLRLQDGREDLDESEAAQIIARLPMQVEAVIITYLDDATDILELLSVTNANWVQLHGNATPGLLRELAAVHQDIRIIRSLIVRNQDARELERQIDAEAPFVSAFITDSHDPETGRTGATGRVHDWTVSRQLVAHAPKPVILAGGLDETNVVRGIEAVSPAAVDAHSGLEDDSGRKDPVRVRQFIERAKVGLQSRSPG